VDICPKLAFPTPGRAVLRRRKWAELQAQTKKDGESIDRRPNQGNLKAGQQP